MTDHFHTAADGTKLFARIEGGSGSTLTPLLCLPGLTRNSSDFDPVFDRYAKSRLVIGVDFRGRGKSGFAVDPKTYRPDVEMQDTLSLLDSVGVSRVATLGTSRGGIVGLFMAALAKPRMAGLCLNDIGCQLNPEGLLRIMSYVGAARHYPDWDTAASAFAWGAAGFDDVPFETWLAVVKRIYKLSDSGIVHNHDLALAQSLPSEADVRGGKLPDLWPFMAAVQDIPLTLLRGAASDLLSDATAIRMRSEAPHMQYHAIPGRGHVPFLDEAESIAALDGWLAEVDTKEKGR